MKLIPPVQISDAMLISSSIAETDYPAWVSGSSYAQDALCMRSSTHSVYQRLTAGAGTTPPESDPINWIRNGPTNRWAAFDQAVGTASTGTDSISFTVAPGIVSAMALLDLVGNEVTVVMTDGATEVYRKVIDLNSNTNVIDAYTYCFEPILMRTTGVLLDLPPVASGHITVHVDGDGPVGIGTFAVGAAFDMGETRFGVELGLIDYSVKTTDKFGTTTFSERPIADRMTVPFVVRNTNLDNVMRMLKSRRTKPSVWIGATKFDSTVIYGLARDARPLINYSTVTECTVTIEGLVNAN